jgi:uncharacterized HhH-GPD family protein
MTTQLHITGDAAADSLLSTEPLALLIGMLLDQQVPMETAFAGPAKLRDRLGHFDAARVAAHDAEDFADLCRQSPAVHRFPGAMAERIQALCVAIIADWSGDTAAIWTRSAPDGAEVVTRLRALPGFGEQKAKIFLALLGKQYGVTAEGWRAASSPYGDAGALRSVADIVDPGTLAKVREHKRAAKSAAKSAKD